MKNTIIVLVFLGCNFFISPCIARGFTVLDPPNGCPTVSELINPQPKPSFEGVHSAIYVDPIEDEKIRAGVN